MSSSYSSSSSAPAATAPTTTPFESFPAPAHAASSSSPWPSFDKHKADYSLYLVTDSTPKILPAGKSLCDVVEAALRGSSTSSSDGHEASSGGGGGGGVTCVQYREKHADTGAMIATARELHAITRKYGRPLLINDRVDVALAVGCEGVHIGQDDIDVQTARKLLGDDKIIGVTVSNAEEIEAACRGGADYLGIGTVFATATKENTKSIIGIEGLQQLLQKLEDLKSSVKTVCIGGLNKTNISRVLWQSTTPSGRSVDGVALVSAIMAAPEPGVVAAQLLRVVKTPPAFSTLAPAQGQLKRPPQDLLEVIPEVITAVDAKKPLSHNMTNLVVQNIAANVALCVGASPIMANYGEEAQDLAKLGGALVVNMGTVTPEGLQNYEKALKAYNEASGPVVFDPVGAGATAVRRKATRFILGAGYISVIKGNQSEVLSCLPGGSTVQQRGVDSSADTSDLSGLTASIKTLASLRRNIVVMTGKVDYVTAGEAVYAIENGHEYLGMVTGTGCCLGTTISAMVAAYPKDGLAAVLAGLVIYNIAAEIAAEREDVRGPGTFVPAFLDELWQLRRRTVLGDIGWLGRARVSLVQ
ncbi:Hydroxyethylthiazole kinase family-domain-containing protein [Microdochium trichocladiopsis]|uniref:Hydroxyethylthiazole kinase family-domain-containing protein n=1 Tax=Microdochium trichocladiopsis TaxID=1682393 RepID=A0A9P8YFX5_9PEZI|nr:Hydroxyethylthiazole kinase family-domain-containing protein [Microdochium trichocladiopsis]KAH7038162.1 Hydroxyethylthiazole kinase family-domain-containing protein [Microdochium trichocladiopsis]